MTAIINSSMFKDGELCLPDQMTADDWKVVHSDLTRAKHLCKKWHKTSRQYGEKHFGTEFTAEWEAQLEFSLGLPSDDTKETTLNPKDKSRVFVSIEGINQQFSMWQRKMEEEIPNWDNDKCKRALGLLEPIEQQAAKLRAMIHKATAQ